MEENQVENSKNASPRTIFGFPADSAFRDLVWVVSITFSLTIIAAYYEFSQKTDPFLKSLFDTIEHLSNSVPCAICLTVLWDIGGHIKMLVRQWLDQRHALKKQAQEEALKQKIQQEVKQEFAEKVKEWSIKKASANNSGSKFDEPPPWEE